MLMNLINEFLVDIAQLGIQFLNFLIKSNK